MLIVDSQIHLWQNGKMSAHHRQIPTYSKDDALAEMATAGVDCAVIHPPSSLGEAVNTLAVEAVKAHPDRFCILGPVSEHLKRLAELKELGVDQFALYLQHDAKESTLAAYGEHVIPVVA